MSFSLLNFSPVSFVVPSSSSAAFPSSKPHFIHHIAIAPSVSYCAYLPRILPKSPPPLRLHIPSPLNTTPSTWRTTRRSAPPARFCAPRPPFLSSQFRCPLLKSPHNSQVVFTRLSTSRMYKRHDFSREKADKSSETDILRSVWISLSSSVILFNKYILDTAGFSKLDLDKLAVAHPC